MKPHLWCEQVPSERAIKKSLYLQMKHFFFFLQRIMRTKSTNPTPPAPGRAGDTGKSGGKIREHFLSAV